MAEAVIHPGLEDQPRLAERQRLIAHSLADLQLVHRYMELGALRDDYGQPFSPVLYQEAHGTSQYVIRPTFIREGMERGLLTGLVVAEAVVSGGGTNTLIYDKFSNGSKLTLSIGEFVTGTETLDFESIEEIGVDGIEKDDSLTGMVARMSAAALHATTTSSKQKQRYAAQAERRQRKLNRPLL